MDTRVLTLCLLVVLAGCSGGGEETPTPLDVPTVAKSGAETPTRPPADATPRPKATIDGVGYPPGADGRGILNGRAIVTATYRAVANGDTEFRGNRTTVGEKETTSRVLTTRVDEESHRLLRAARVRERTAGDAWGNWTETVSVYANRSFATVRRGSGRQPTYQRATGDNVTTIRGTAATDAATRIVESGYWRPTGTTSIRGDTAVVFEVTDTSGEYRQASGTGSAAEWDVTVEGTIAVTPDGVLRRGVVRQTATDGERRRTVVVHYRLDTANVTVERPVWLDDVENGTE